jgi:6-phospho 3-hexuloisomerase
MTKFYRELLARIRQVVTKIGPEEVKRFVAMIKDARRVYVVGSGRSGLVAKAFAMRLVHLRKRTFVVGETVVPAMRSRQDILVAVSGSGRTRSVVEIARTARHIGGKVAAVTGQRNSPLAFLADLVVQVPITNRKTRETGYDARQLLGKAVLAPLGSLFELSALVFFESIIAQLMQELKITEDQMRRQHTVLE